MRLGRLRRMGRRGVIALLVVLLAVVGTGAWLLTRPSGAAAAQTVTSTVAAGTYQQNVAATGALEPTREADLDFAVSGRVTHVYVAVGDKVVKGDRLATLDTSSLDAALTSAQAQLDAAEAQYDDDVDADASSTQLSSDSAAVAAARSALSQAQDDLDSATLSASMTGTVASVDLTVGEQVSGSSSSSSPSSDGSDGANGATAPDASSDSSTTSQVVIVSPRHFKVVADVAADDIASVKKGMQAQVTPSGAASPVYGTVTDVGLVAEASSSGAATFPVTVTVTGAQAELYAGTSATVSIITKQVSNVLAVPSQALHTSGTSTYVEKLVGGKQVRTPVEVGETYGSNTEITSGLKAGDKVVLVTLKLPTGNGNTGNRFPDGGEGNFPGGGAGPPAGKFQGPDGATVEVGP
ncbi:efflux RND transporter periplasmic adaptor subunit [Marmoricola sp. URHB0036]|uniref:efflux RND transporter periplasmic adaptor subunit n=1 Tax=Marmoricola sp. URHB0036 TaxID=1298863 RepID=UPI000421C824|nr:biotin/lipoyl-binding protein [Marmoricola sp. URHB0036]